MHTGSHSVISIPPSSLVFCFRVLRLTRAWHCKIWRRFPFDPLKDTIFNKSSRFRFYRTARLSHLPCYLMDARPVHEALFPNSYIFHRVMIVYFFISLSWCLPYSRLFSDEPPLCSHILIVFSLSRVSYVRRWATSSTRPDLCGLSRSIFLSEPPSTMTIYAWWIRPSCLHFATTAPAFSLTHIWHYRFHE